MLPRTFSGMESVGALHTYTLNQPYQLPIDGLPGITSRPEWFAIDYYGVFWIKTSGEYRFRMTSDDGAELYIDDHRLLNLDGVHSPLTDDHSISLAAGRHTIHLPYFQQMIHVALILQVKPPGEDFKLFDLRDFAPLPAAQ
jgi:hypothetical protein